MKLAPRHVVSDHLARSSSPFSHVVVYDGIGYISGIIGQAPDTGQIVSPDFIAQVRRALQNLAIVLAELGALPSDVLRTTIYLVNYADFEAMNTAYRETFSSPYPARVTLAAHALPLQARFQIDAIVATDSSAQSEHAELLDQ
jgi:2-iminobutanoate/2-iminopropanoate deaminase